MPPLRDPSTEDPTDPADLDHDGFVNVNDLASLIGD